MIFQIEYVKPPFTTSNWKTVNFEMGGVTSLSEVGAGSILISWKAFLTKRIKPNCTLTIRMEIEWLKKFLNIYWLRPENALWRAASCKILQELEFSEPSIDLSCGDGVFSFLLAGGDFETEFDIFGATGDLDRFFEHEDIYNHHPSDYNPAIKCQPPRGMSVGTDWKQSLLHKADQLDFYDELTQHDNNKKLPFGTSSFRTVFSNSVYWIENSELHLNEIARILQPGGQAHLVIKNSNVRNLLDQFQGKWSDALGEEFIDTIDRGRSEHYAQLHNPRGWERKLKKAGLDIIQKQPTVTQAHSQMWDIGLRPISPHLIRMANSMEPDERVDVKKDWIETWLKLLKPFCSPGWDYTERAAPEIVYSVKSS